MPELPEVETVRRAILPALAGRTITDARISNPALRLKVPPSFPRTVTGRTITDVRRRAKYLVVKLDAGDLLIHLGMSGTLRVVPADAPAIRHDHAEIMLDSGRRLVFNDPRRFGLVLWTEDAMRHRLLSGLGLEPMSRKFNAHSLGDMLRDRKIPVKCAIMDPKLVVGIGNIYASESLHGARISPKRRASSLGPEEHGRLARAIKDCLRRAIHAGGSTLRDFCGADGLPGHFQLRHRVYGRKGQKCRSCGRNIRTVVQAQRTTYYCPACQR